MATSRGTLLVAVLAAASSHAAAFYLPGVAPREYPVGAPVQLKVNKLTSSRAQLPYAYYTLPFCQPKDRKAKVENLGEILMGDAIENSPYEIKMMTNETCKYLCTVPLDEAKRNHLRGAINDEYMVNWIVDNLPAATHYVRSEPGASPEPVLLAGFPVGVLRNGKHLVHNHVVLALSAHTNPGVYDDYRVVGFEVEPYSMNQATRADGEGGQVVMCQDGVAMAEFNVGNSEEIIYTYDVQWKESSVRWATRWDTYLRMTSGGGQIHWFSIMNSLLIVLFLSAMVAMILLRTVFRDIAKYNEIATEEEAKEETGWKLVHADVFREPEQSELLAVSFGSGVQLLLMAIVVLIFAILGFLSPARRGGLLQSMVLLFTFMGLPGGYAMARMYKVFGKSDCRVPTILTATLYPGFVFLCFFLLNLMIWSQGSSGSVPFLTMFAMLVLWFGVSVPLVFLGAHLGWRKPAIELPVRISKIARPIPEQPTLNSPLLTCLVGGVLPFGAIFTELFFIMSSMWLHQFYYLFGFLGLTLVILIITCTEISIALTYFQLTSEDYCWWWRAFFGSGASSIYVMLHSVLYFNTRLEITHMAGTLLYFGYMSVICVVFFLVTGSIGFFSSFLFVRAIYGSIKVD